MTEYTNDYEPVELLGLSLTSTRFMRLRGGAWTAIQHKKEYLVFADTLKFRMDGQPHPLDVRELRVLSTEEIVSEDGSVSVTIEVKG
ncbi:hypothetical protein ACCS66_03935 [Rhizobium ruizarguesonis]